MKKLVILSTFLVATQMAYAHPMDRHHPPSVKERVEHMTKDLSLTKAQADTITKILSGHEKERKALESKLWVLHKQERKQIEAVLTKEQKEKMAARFHHRADKKADKKS